jgi:hypothetical protein
MIQRYSDGDNQCKPDAVTYSAVISAVTKAEDLSRAAIRAEELLHEAISNYSNDDEVKLNSSVFNTVIDAWARSGDKRAPSRAEKILKCMNQLYEETGYEGLQPTINISMQKQYEEGNTALKPNTAAYNAVLSACAFTRHEEDREEAFRIAFRLFNEMSSRKSFHPDNYTYTILLSVCEYLLPKEQVERRFLNAKKLFEQCCETGYVNG